MKNSDKSTNEEHSRPNTAHNNSGPGEPSFLVKDVERYQTRFKPTLKANLEQRQKEGKVYSAPFMSDKESDGKSLNNGSILNSIISNRVAMTTKCPADNSFYGNANEIAHLLKYKPGTTTSLVNFETQLRRYTSTTGQKNTEAWAYRGSESIPVQTKASKGLKIKKELQPES